MYVTWFPFTVIQRPMLGILSRCFSRTVVYRPMAGSLPGEMAAAVEAGWLEVRVPVGGDDPLLAKQIEEFQQWGGLHHDAGLAALMAVGAERPPLRDASAPSAIRAAIRREAAGAGEEDAVNPVDRARLFLGLAEAYDLQAAAMAANLASLDGLEDALMRQIHGGSTPDDPVPVGRPLAPPPDPGRLMTAARLRAWACLAASDPEPVRVLVTDSPAVIDQLADLHDAMTLAGDPVPVPDEGTEPAVLSAWQDALAETIAAIEADASGREEAFALPGGAAATRLSLYRLVLADAQPPGRLAADIGTSSPRVWIVGFLGADNR